MDQKMIITCHDLFQRGMVTGAGGNVSIRHNDGLLITPSGHSLGELQNQDLVHLNLLGQKLSSGRPSRETPFHLAIYNKRSDVDAIIHIHSPYATALACLFEPGKEIPIYTPSYALMVGKLPIIPYYCPGSAKLEDAVVQGMINRDSMLLQNHGVITIGKTLTAARHIAEEIEENAHIYFLTSGQGRSLGPGEIEELKNIYG